MFAATPMPRQARCRQRLASISATGQYGAVGLYAGAAVMSATLVLMPVAIVGVVLMQLLRTDVHPLVPALQSTWLHVHVTLAMPEPSRPGSTGNASGSPARLA